MLLLLLNVMSIKQLCAFQIFPLESLMGLYRTKVGGYCDCWCQWSVCQSAVCLECCHFSHLPRHQDIFFKNCKNVYKYKAVCACASVKVKKILMSYNKIKHFLLKTGLICYLTLQCMFL